MHYVVSRPRSIVCIGSIVFALGCDSPPPATPPLQLAATAQERFNECNDLCSNVCGGDAMCSKSCNVVEQRDTNDDGMVDEQTCEPTTCGAEVSLPCGTDGTGGSGGGGSGGDTGGEPGDGPSYFCDSFVCTQIMVHTCDVNAGGTDSAVAMRLQSPSGASPFFALDHRNHDDHERNTWYDHTFSEPEGIRSPTSFTITHDGSRDHSRWCFDSVFVRVSGCPKHNDWEEFVFNGARSIDGESITLDLTQTKACE